MTIDQERSYLQRAVAVAALVPVTAGLFGVLMGSSLTGDRTSISADSHFRYLSGLLLGIGILFWSTLPTIERQNSLFRHLCLVVVLGGLARLLGLVLTGVPSFAMIGGMFMELAVTPALFLWQMRVANRFAEHAPAADGPMATAPPAL